MQQIVRKPDSQAVKVLKTSQSMVIFKANYLVMGSG